MKTIFKPLLFLALIGLLLIFSEALSQGVIAMIDALWKLDDGTVKKLNDRLNLLTKGVGMAGSFAWTIWICFTWFWKRPKPKEKKPIKDIVSPSIAADRSENLKGYYQELRKECECIDLSLVDAKFTEYARSVQGRITLPVVYQEMEALPHLRKKEGSENPEDKMGLRGEDRKPLMQLCAGKKYRRVVVLGDPGSGKSMFLDNLAWQVAGSHVEETDDRLPAEFRRLPLVRIRLRSAAWDCLQDGFDLVAALKREVESVEKERGEETWSALEAPLLQHGLILLDGLDEVPETEGMRVDMLDAIDGLVKALGPEARLIITSRPYVFEAPQDTWLDAFACLELQPMSNAQIESFIDHWYRLLRETRGRSEETARRQAHRLFVELQDRDYLLEPARRPLILILLTSLHFAREILRAFARRIVSGGNCADAGTLDPTHLPGQSRISPR